jgi:hypothetical protein
MAAAAVVARLHAESTAADAAFGARVARLRGMLESLR